MLRLCHIENTACRPCLLTHNSDQFSWEIPRAAAAQADTCGNNAQEQIPGTSRSQCWNFCDGVKVSAALKSKLLKSKAGDMAEGQEMLAGRAASSPTPCFEGRNSLGCWKRKSAPNLAALGLHHQNWPRWEPWSRQGVNDHSGHTGTSWLLILPILCCFPDRGATCCMAGEQDPSGCFVLWEVTETLAPHSFPCMAENQGNEISLNLQACCIETRGRKNTLAFLFRSFQARANKSGQYSSFVTEINLQNMLTFAWTEIIWAL